MTEEKKAEPKTLDKFAEKERDEKAIADMKEAASLKIQAKRDPGYNKRPGDTKKSEEEKKD